MDRAVIILLAGLLIVSSIDVVDVGGKKHLGEAILFGLVGIGCWWYYAIHKPWQARVRAAVAADRQEFDRIVKESDSKSAELRRRLGKKPDLH